MNIQNLKELLEKTDDKLSIFTNSETLNKYDFLETDFYDLINEFLNDEEKLRLFDYPLYQQCDSWTKYEIIGSISDEVKAEMLTDIDLIANKLHLSLAQITDLAKKLSSEDAKIKILKIYNLTNIQQGEIIKTLSDDKKINILLKGKNDFNKLEMIFILSSLDIKSLGEFLLEHKNFCIENDIHPYEIVHNLNAEQQMNFVKILEDMNLTLNEKREILAILQKRVKVNLDTTNFPKEYITALNIRSTKDGKKVYLDLEKDLEDYRGLDNLIRIDYEDFTEDKINKITQLCDICPKMKIYPKKFTENQRTKFMQLCDIYPNLRIDTDGLVMECFSTTKEYKEAEEWINSIIDNLNPEYSKAQKIALIDNAIGKKISYSPDFDTEVFNPNDCRALWKIITSGYGVCNGIAEVEQYIFSRIGVESEIINSERLSFIFKN